VIAALALQGPLARDVLEAATGESFADLRYFRRRPSKIGRVSLDVSRTGYTGDLGYELWIPARRRGQDMGRADGRRQGVRHPARRDARAGRGPARGRPDPHRGRLHVRPPRHEPTTSTTPRSRSGSAGWSASTRAISSAGSRSSARRGPAVLRAGSSASSSTGTTSRALYDEQGLPPAISPVIDRSPVPVFAGGRQVGRATSHGWSPILKQAHRARVGRAAVRGDRQPRLGRMDGRGPTGTRQRDGGRAPLPGSRAQARLTRPSGGGVGRIGLRAPYCTVALKPARNTSRPHGSARATVDP
jgi:hypothetical protein